MAKAKAKRRTKKAGGAAKKTGKTAKKSAKRPMMAAASRSKIKVKKKKAPPTKKSVKRVIGTKAKKVIGNVLTGAAVGAVAGAIRAVATEMPESKPPEYNKPPERFESFN